MLPRGDADQLATTPRIAVPCDIAGTPLPSYNWCERAPTRLPNNTLQQKHGLFGRWSCPKIVKHGPPKPEDGGGEKNTYKSCGPLSQAPAARINVLWHELDQATMVRDIAESDRVIKQLKEQFEIDVHKEKRYRNMAKKEIQKAMTEYYAADEIMDDAKLEEIESYLRRHGVDPVYDIPKAKFIHLPMDLGRQKHNNPVEFPLQGKGWAKRILNYVVGSHRDYAIETFGKSSNKEIQAHHYSLIMKAMGCAEVAVGKYGDLYTEFVKQYGEGRDDIFEDAKELDLIADVYGARHSEIFKNLATQTVQRPDGTRRTKIDPVETIIKMAGKHIPKAVGEKKR